MMAIQENPPDDDVCPICFGDYVVPYRAQCGHWFCGSCILQLWNHGNALGPCKCPMCSRFIKALTPPSEVSLNQQDLTDKDETRKVAKAIERYNRLFVGGTRGYVQMLRETPFFLRRTLEEMVDPNQVDAHYLKWRFFSLTLAFLYVISPFDFIPKSVNIQLMTNLLTVVLVTLIKLVGWYKRRRSVERVRRLAAAEFDFVQPERSI